MKLAKQYLGVRWGLKPLLGYSKVKRKHRPRMRLENEIKVEKRREVIVLDIRGDITSYSEVPLKTSFQKNIVQEARNIVIKIESQAYINSGGIALLIQILYQAQENRQNLAIAGVSPHYKKIFNMVGITKFAKLYDRLETVLERLDSQPESHR
jgi:anti-anti-sigma factor